MSIPHQVVTREEEWDPKRVQLQGVCKTNTDTKGIYELEDSLRTVSSCYVEQEYHDALTKAVRISQMDTSNSRHPRVTPQDLSRTLRVGLDTATKTLRATTQRGVRTALHPITRRYHVDHLAFNRKRLGSEFYTDGLKSSITSLNGNNYAQVFTNGKYTAVYPMKSQREAGSKLRAFVEDVGVPDQLMADLAGEHVGSGTEFQDVVRHNRIQMRWSEQGRSTQNSLTEREIGILRKRWQSRMVERCIPRRLWDYGLVYESKVLSRISRGHSERPGLEELTGNTIDISEWLDFSFYDLVWYWDKPKPTNDKDAKLLGRWLGVANPSWVFPVLLGPYRVGKSPCTHHRSTRHQR